MESPEGEYATAHEIEQAIDGLSDEDLVRLERFARYQVYRYPAINPKEVLGEAVVRMLRGDRSWPRQVRFHVFVCNVMRSVADDMRNQARKSQEALPIEELDAHMQEETCDTTEQEASDRRLLQEIWKVFDDDAEVQVLLKGIEDGMSAKEVQEKFGLSPEKYDAARKRMERTIAKRYPNGMNS